MGIYRNFVFPRLMDRSLQREDLMALRKQVLADARGSVLELGFGTGLNLPHYPAAVTQLTVLDVNPGMAKLAQRRIAASPIPVRSAVLDAARLPFADASFATVVSTLTLCSIAALGDALEEVARVLRPDGHFLFLEHGLDRNERVQKWQRRLNGVSRYFGDGCCIDRDIRRAVAEKMSLEWCEEFRFAGFPRTHAAFYRGSAQSRRS